MNGVPAFSIRKERRDDAVAITRVLTAAFPTPSEADLVATLRCDGDVALSLVACTDDEVVGTIVFSPLAHDGERDQRFVALAPLAVDPRFQRKGAGAALIRRAHDALAREGAVLSLVLGDPAYYMRFGYSTAEAASFRTPFDGPYLMALRLSDVAPRGGSLAYAPAFSGLS